MKYNINFVPRIEERKLISPLRYKLCKQTKVNEALRYPVHMSLISGGFETKDIKLVENELRKFCLSQKPISLSTFKKTDILLDKNWTGIHIKNTLQLDNIRKSLQKIRNKYAKEKETHFMTPPHITLAFKADVSNIIQYKTPISKILFDRITISRQKTLKDKYRIYKHFKFK